MSPLWWIKDILFVVPERSRIATCFRKAHISDAAFEDPPQ